MAGTVLFAPESFNLAEVTRALTIAARTGPETTCVFAGHSPRWAHLVEAAGFTFRHLQPELTAGQAAQLLRVDQGRGLRHPFSDEMLRARVAGERALIRELDAAAVVIGTTLSQLVSARAEGVPLVHVKPFAFSSVHVRQMRTTGVLSRRTRPHRALDAAVAGVARGVLPHLPVLPRSLVRVARENGVPLPPTALDALDADLNLIATAPQLCPDVDLPASHEVVGPVFASLPGDPPDLVGRLAALPTPLVYVAVGSSGSRDLVLTLLHGLGGAPVQVLSPVRHLLTADDVAALAANVHVTDLLPADRLGPSVDLAVTHGGEGTVQTSCAQGWPFIGIPLQLEQRFNVQRCVELGTARLVSPRRARHVDWAALVSDALRDRRLRARASTLAAAVSQLDGAGAAARRIERLVP